MNEKQAQRKEQTRQEEQGQQEDQAGQEEQRQQAGQAEQEEQEQQTGQAGQKEQRQQAGQAGQEEQRQQTGQTPEWSAMRKKIKSKFNKLSDSDINSLNGHMDKLRSKVQNAYGYDYARADKECCDFNETLTPM